MGSGRSAVVAIAVFVSAVFVGAAALTSCSTTDGDDATAVATTIVTETVTSTSPPRSASGSDASSGDAGPATAPASAGARLTVTDIRTGVHDGFDRVVYELDGAGTPGWRVAYVDEAIQDGSGRPVEVDGNGVLEVRILGSAYPHDSGAEPYGGPDPVRAQSGGAVVEVHGALVFEGITQSFIGVTEYGAPFTVVALTNPTRLVIDVRR
ncbi:AMIN-like domain-containing (lipo)protein [Gordonia aurantiaca]|uniref:AMIN-like domain-containing (lipo)protein n=1 Tax=Gordonia sp. B21 TaxID=3151852 RepID=UPI0032653F76